MSDDALYELFYWPGLPGRGELIRLAFEESDTPYIDAGVRDGYEACMGITSPEFRDDANPPPFAVPVLRAGSLLLSQTSNILFYLGPLLHLAPEDDISRLHINQLFNVVIDCINEAHDTHHPVSMEQTYEEQKEPALKRATVFREKRIPKFLSYFERVIEQNTGSSWLYGNKLTYVDLGLYFLIDGLLFAFPKTTKAELTKDERIHKLYNAVKERPKIKEYLESDRRQAFEKGIFRHYPEFEEAGEAKAEKS